MTMTYNKAGPAGHAVNRKERILARGMIEGKTKGWQHQQMMQKLAEELPSIRYL